MICTTGKELLVFQEIFVSGATENYYDKYFIYRVLSTQQHKRNSESGDSSRNKFRKFKNRRNLKVRSGKVSCF